MIVQVIIISKCHVSFFGVSYLIVNTLFHNQAVSRSNCSYMCVISCITICSVDKTNNFNMSEYLTKLLLFFFSLYLMVTNNKFTYNLLSSHFHIQLFCRVLKHD